MINLSTLDIILIVFFFVLTLGIGFWVSRQSSKSATDYFLSGRNMPWWLLGVSMVATTFSTDTPNLVTDIVRTNGVSGNWVWWAFLLTGLLTVFVYAKLWRKSNVKTDMEFYELRYGGKPAKFLRAFRAIYLGLLFNIFAMAGVTLAAIKIGGIMLGLQPWETVLYAGVVTVIFSTVGGFKGVVYTDFILFFTAMIGAIGAAVYVIGMPEVGGLEALLKHENVTNKLDLIPDLSNTESLITLLIIPLAVQWWSSWYPGAEPGGGGYIAQRMLAAKDENNAIGATFFFNVMHYALRPWPWILVALASLVVFPDLLSIQEAFPNISEDKIGHDLAYPAMLTKLPSGLLGLVLASLIAAFMSTISTHLNWGSSYLVNDVYKQHINKNATEKQQVMVGKSMTILLMVFSAVFALTLKNALQLFDIIIMFGAGTGLIFILRWFWWRINAWSEIVAMIVSGIVSLLLTYTYLGEFLFGAEGTFASWMKFPFIVLITSFAWLIATFITEPETHATLTSFYLKIEPGGPGWTNVINRMTREEKLTFKAKGWTVPKGITSMLIGSLFIYSILFATGSLIYGDYTKGCILIVIVIIAGWLLSKFWKKIKSNML